MRRETRSYFEMLLYAAFESSTYRVVQSIHKVDAYTVAMAYDAARTACRKLGYFCKVRGGDARESPLFEGLEFKADYTQCYESWRRVVVDDLSPKVIFEVTERANILEWNGFKVFIIGQQVPGGINDGWAPNGAMVVSGEKGEVARLERMHEQPYERARKAYRLMAGRGYNWDDGLPHDHVADMEYLAQA